MASGLDRGVFRWAVLPVGRIDAVDLGHGVVRARLGHGLLGGGRRQSLGRVHPVHQDWRWTQASGLHSLTAVTGWLMPG